MDNSFNVCVECQLHVESQVVSTSYATFAAARNILSSFARFSCSKQEANVLNFFTAPELYSPMIHRKLFPFISNNCVAQGSCIHQQHVSSPLERRGSHRPPVLPSVSEATMSSPSTLKSATLLEQMKLHLAADAGKELTKKVGLVYQINIAPKKLGVDEEIYIVDLKKGEVTKGPYEGKPDATFSFKDDDFVKVATGKMNPQIAFMRGAMKIKGSLSAAQKFTPDIFPKPSKM
ncbi:PREDICTED: hydroxysteroid dehydrogenase-like protein 2 [Nelumbo nucifera]|uniref:Hydroxysteroid dehydrogenase-like protein 2 n=2 Tax=Nelumbo nucifera TaxID=4432 RepID=A0A1U8AA01_NELNU|nr:PREDICTED: hydroxysteroid dehydrogenase-like protein 2 [Nelumbo nucifera]